MSDYAAFLARKAQAGAYAGFEADALPSFLFDFQRALVQWSLRKGRAAVFADCGLGKTPMELAWADSVLRETNRPVLIMTPLAVAQQTVREGAKFGIDCRRDEARSGIAVTNYERLHHFRPEEWGGVVCDESSAIKAFDGQRRAQVTEFLRTIPRRSLWTATAAPNDYIELGTSSEALGEMGHVDMLNRFFVNDQNTSDLRKKWRGQDRDGGKWRFKGHAETAYWRWVCSWARALRKPSDLGFSDERFALPPLVEREHVVEVTSLPAGKLFPLPAQNFFEEREERRRTIRERCETAASLVADTGQPAVVWCHLNDEGDLLEKLIPDSRQVAGAHSDEEKEEAFEAFSAGQLRVLVIKPRIGAFGLNWQHCAHVVTFASHSYEQYYQAVRRCWRFGQTRPVVVDLVATEGERSIKENLRRKAAAADRMFSELVAHMNEALGHRRAEPFHQEAAIPSWL